MTDIRFALRQLRKSPLFTVVAVLSLAIGVGANTAVFSLVNEFLLRALPVRNPDELVLLRTIEGVGGRMSRAGENNGSIDPVTGRAASTSFSLQAFERLRSLSSALSDVFAFAPFNQVNVLVDGLPDVTASAQLVSGNYYGALGVPAAIGRTLAVPDDRPESTPVATISYRYWERRFQARADVVGRVIHVNRVPTVIVGVSAHGFDGTMQAGESPDITVPIAQHLRFQPQRASRGQPWYWWVRIMGRRRPGATHDQVRASLEPVFQQSAKDGWLAGGGRETDTDRAMPALPTLAADPGSHGENDLRRQYARSLRIIMGLVGIVLAAACANVANLLLARGVSRRREIAVRLALGASRRRIVSQLMIESLLLAAAGAVIGMALAWTGRGLLLAVRPFGNAALVLDLPLDVRVLAFTALVTLGTTLLFGLAPALRSTRLDLNAQFQGGTRMQGSEGASGLSRALMIIQVALSLVLLVGTGLFVRTLTNLEHVDAGFNRRDLILFRIDAASAGYQRTEYTTLQDRLQARLERVPGVRGATFSSTALLSRVRQNRRIAVPGTTPPAGAPPVVNTNGLATNFFATMELPLVLGRAFDDRDDEPSAKVAIVNQAFVRQFFAGDNPVGRAIGISPAYGDRVEIVGVAADAQYTDLRSPAPPTVYLPSRQQVDGYANFAVRVDGAAASAPALFGAIRAAVREVDPALPVLDLRTQTEQIDRLHGQERLFARLSGFFGTVALVLACVGLYGLMSHSVLRRTSEIGLRMALGAAPAQVLRMVLRESLQLVAGGIALGTLGALGAARLVRTMLFGLNADDPTTYVVVSMAMVAVAAIAAFAPARRASRIDPLVALRSE